MSEIDRYADWMGEGRHDDGPEPEVEEQFDVFVYGTLRRGERNHDYFLKRAEFLGVARVQGQLVDLGSYPGLLAREGEVVGEVYRVDATTLARLDILEGHPHHYRRTEVDARLNDGNVVPVQLYVYQERSWGLPYGAIPLPVIDGEYDWTRKG